MILELANELPAVHDRHHQIRHDDVGPSARLELLDGVAAMDRQAGLVSFAHEQLAERLPQRGLVLDDQNAHSPG